MIAIDDPHLPGLAGLDAARLCRIAGAPEVRPLRLRYREGRRAILHVATGPGAGPGAGASDGASGGASEGPGAGASDGAGAGPGQGVLWFFRGDKARRLARRTPSARFDAETGALFEAFPSDHRMPQIARFLGAHARRAPGLPGGAPGGPPQVLRYRPGLSCTFRCPRRQGDAVFVKLITDDDPARLAQMNRLLAEHLADGPLAVAGAIGTDAGLGAISYAAAPGRPLDDAMRAADSAGPVAQGIAALRHLWRLPLTPPRHLSRAALLLRAQDSARLVRTTVPQAGPRIDRLVARLETRSAEVACRPIHADMKLEHLFVQGARVTLIDTESLALGPPDYDLAQLYGRIRQAEIEGALPVGLADAAAAEVRRAAGADFDWCLGVVAVRLAKFHAQRPAADAAARVAAILDRLE